ncbi:hypothetical protein DFH09DRAFT_1229472 [Mycena vulgaris]|nr:hypothetical protein DFH09DRAFT_1229472 [Mycena vulgaris]
MCCYVRNPSLPRSSILLIYSAFLIKSYFDLHCLIILLFQILIDLIVPILLFIISIHVSFSSLFQIRFCINTGSNL